MCSITFQYFPIVQCSQKQKWILQMVRNAYVCKSCPKMTFDFNQVKIIYLAIEWSIFAVFISWGFVSANRNFFFFCCCFDTQFTHRILATALFLEIYQTIKLSNNLWNGIISETIINVSVDNFVSLYISYSCVCVWVCL